MPLNINSDFKETLENVDDAVTTSIEKCKKHSQV